MSKKRAHATYDWLCRAVTKLEREVALYEEQLKEMGKNLEIAGQQFQSFNFSVNRERLEKDVAVIWETADKYKRAAKEYAERKSQKEKGEPEI
jgi:hypothetical protein